MLEKYIKEQDIVTRLLMQSIRTKKLSQAYLFVCDDIEYIYNYAKDFTKDIIKLSDLDEKKLDNIYKRIDKEEYNELKIIEPIGNIIKKEQLLDLQKEVLNKPVEANKIVYIIKNAEKLNSSSANSILKFLEEPLDDVIAILLTDDINSVMATIKSRCQILNFKNISGKINDKLEILDIEVQKKLIDSSIEFFNKIEKNKKNVFIYEKSLLFDNFKTTDEILILIDILIYAYMNLLYLKLDKKINHLNDYLDIIKEHEKKNTINDIIKKINILEQIKIELNSNVNSKLIFDQLIIELSEV